MKKSKINYTNLFAMFIICFGIGAIAGGAIIQNYTKKCIELRYIQYYKQTDESFGGDESLEAKDYIIHGQTNE